MAAHLAGRGAPYVEVEPALARIDDVAAKVWIEDLEKQCGRTLLPVKRGPKPRLAPSPAERRPAIGAFTKIAFRETGVAIAFVAG